MHVRCGFDAGTRPRGKAAARARAGTAARERRPGMPRRRGDTRTGEGRPMHIKYQRFGVWSGIAFYFLFFIEIKHSEDRCNNCLWDEIGC